MSRFARRIIFAVMLAASGNAEMIPLQALTKHSP